MGYTHYWHQENGDVPSDLWEKFVSDCKKILALIQKSGVALCYEYDEPRSKVHCSKDMVRFNGPNELGHETFILSPNEIDFQFCKTAQKPYDLAVCSCLILALHHFGDYISVSSDGDPADWTDAVRLVFQTFGYGDFPFTDEDVRERFVEDYVPQALADLEAARKEIGLDRLSEVEIEKPI